MGNNVSEVRVWPQDGHPTIKARGDAVFFNALRVKFTLFGNKDGMSVGMPGRYGSKEDPETGKKKWYSDVWVNDEDLRKELLEKVVTKYKEENTGPTSQGEAAGPTDQGGTSVPF